jgi:hypothetical protein
VAQREISTKKSLITGNIDEIPDCHAHDGNPPETPFLTACGDKKAILAVAA